MSKAKVIIERQIEELGREKIPHTIIENSQREYVERAEQLRIEYRDIPQKKKVKKEVSRGCEDVTEYGVIDFNL